MSDTITIDEIKSAAPTATVTLWKKYGKERHYINIAGSTDKLWLQAGKLHYQIGKGASTSDANATIAGLIGCNVVDRYHAAAGYVVID